ncbi:MAG TPA: hypothetical protein VNH39_00540 [Steroidobacteraceae bacterium]|nr:hypothetical protein [Steroidobacteraceae bacterium]
MPDPAPNPSGGKGPNSYVPKPQFEYKAPSIIAEHKYLAIIFVLAIVAASVYLIRAPHKPLTIEPPPPPPVYIEPIAQPAPDSHTGRS